MYERTFGTDWDALDDRDEAIRRAYALGVAERLGDDNPKELDRLTSEAQTAYDEQFVTLAYRTGRTHAAEVSGYVSGDDAWGNLIRDRDLTDVEELASRGIDYDKPDAVDVPDGLEPFDFEKRTFLPESLARPRLDTRPDDSTNRVSRPSFLERKTRPTEPKLGLIKRAPENRASGGESDSDSESGFESDPGSDSESDSGPGAESNSESGSESGNDDSGGKEDRSSTSRSRE